MFVQVRAASLILSVIAVVTAAVQADEIEERKAQRLIAGHAETIHQFAYFGVKHKSLEFDGARRAKDGSFKHVFTFNGTSEGKTGYFTLEFAFDKDGKLISMKEGGRSWILAPFDQSKLLLAVFKGLVTEFAKDPAIKPETKKQIDDLVKKGDVNQLMIAMLNGKNGH
jgi:hypothetical protein